MDFVSHALVGKLFQMLSRVRSLQHKWIIVSFAFIPDLPVAVVYILLGRERSRQLWIPHNSDWIGVRASHPGWAAAWEIPHSFLFLLLVVIPLVYYFRWPKIAIASYASHIVLDLFTHTGEWRVKPFYPLNYMFDGFADVWAWPLSRLVLSWLVLGIVLLLVKIKTKKTLASSALTGRDPAS